MAKQKQKDPLIEALEEGRSFTVTLPDGGAFHSMRMKLKHGQSLTFSPVTDFREVAVGDIVLAKWRGGGYISHLVGEIQGDQFMIVNSVGKENGWVHGNDLLGRVTGITEPELHPAVSAMLDQLEAAYRELIEKRRPAQGDAARLLSVVDDMRWYAEKMGAEQWERMPASSNQWSYEQHLWHLLKKARSAAESGQAESILQCVNRGKEHVGQVAELLGLFEMGEAQ